MAIAISSVEVSWLWKHLPRYQSRSFFFFFSNAEQFPFKVLYVFATAFKSFLVGRKELPLLITVFLNSYL